ncbi:MAG TPA: hypothetical protein VFV54_09210 [Thermoanaerobaculia bacterium]|nr:hypothetical protein [Thermoanaerobaculia bacterium]
MNAKTRYFILAVTLLAIALPVLAADAPARETSFLFVQNATSGELTLMKGTTDHYELVLHGVSPTTIYFSDRPERIVGDMATEKFLAGLGFPEDNPPNAALDLAEGPNADVLVLELRKPRYDSAKQELRYQVQMLQTADGGLAEFSNRKMATVPAKFERASLFIDDCSDGHVYCYRRSDQSLMGLVTVGFCWKFGDIACHACHKMSGYNDQCNSEYSACGNDCYADDYRH